MKQDKTVFFKKSETLPFVEMRKASKSSACYHAHSHDEFSLGVIDRGSAQYNNLNKKNHIGTGNTVTINPGDIHSCNPDSMDWSYRMLFVDAQWIGQLQSEIFATENFDYQPFSNLFETDQQLYHDFDILFETLTRESNPLVAESLLIRHLAHYFVPTAAYQRQFDKPDLKNIKKVRELILDQLNINHSLNDLSKESGLSRYHLIRCFKQIYGLSPHALQLDERVKKAKILLKSGQSIIETSTELGFSDQSHFQRNFKKRLAVTPKQYQAFFI